MFRAQNVLVRLVHDWSVASCLPSDWTGCLGTRYVVPVPVLGTWGISCHCIGHATHQGALSKGRLCRRAAQSAGWACPLLFLNQMPKPSTRHVRTLHSISLYQVAVTCFSYATSIIKKRRTYKCVLRVWLTLNPGGGVAS